MADLIDRQDVDVLIDSLMYDDDLMLQRKVWEVLHRIQDLPSAEPERRTGKWVDDGTELGLCCSECQKSMDDYVESLDYIYLSEMPIFCPNCGSYNGGAKDE